MTTKSKNAEVTAEIPTGLKELIAACKLEIPEWEYKFQKKPEMIQALTDHRSGGAAPAPKQDAKVEAPKVDKKAAPKKEAKKAAPSVEKTEDVQEEKEEATADEPKEDKKADKQKVKVEAPKAEPKAGNGKKKAGASPEDILALQERADVKAIMEGGPKKDYTTSDKVRALYHKAKPALTIGNIAKVLDIHYSFAYCVVDAYRKNLLNSKTSDKK